MKTEASDYDWRFVLGEDAKALVTSVLREGQKPGSRDLETAIQRLKLDLAVAQGQAEASRTVVAEVTSRLEGTLQGLKRDHDTVMMVVGKAHRELFLIRQLLGLIKLDDRAEAQEVLERLRARDGQWQEFIHSIMPNFEQAFPSFDAELEQRAIRQLTIQAIENDTRIKSEEKAKPGEKEGKGEERER
jgi:hypothetical protein